MVTKIELYERLREHLPEPAARIIAEEMRTEAQVVDRLKHVALREDVHQVELSVEKLRSSLFRWQLTFFVPSWAGVYGTLLAIILRN